MGLYLLGTGVLVALWRTSYVRVAGSDLIIRRGLRQSHVPLAHVTEIIVFSLIYPGAGSAAVQTAALIDHQGTAIATIPLRGWSTDQIARLQRVIGVNLVHRDESLTPAMANLRWPGAFHSKDSWRGYYTIAATILVLAVITAALIWAVLSVGSNK